MNNTIIGKFTRLADRLTTMHRQSGKSWPSVIANIQRLRSGRKFHFVEIHDNELDLRGKEYEESFLNWEEQKVCLDLLNPRKYYSLARNKYLAHLILDAAGIKNKSKLLCYYNPEFGIGTSTIAINLAETVKILKDSGIKEFVVKTTESSHGDNVWVIKTIKDIDAPDPILVKFNGEELRLSSLLGKEPLIFETAIHQTAQMASFNPSSVNTVRFMTCLMPGGTVEIIACFIKIGRAGRCVDNAGSGGNVDSGVDVATGTVYNPILFEGWRKITDITHHPDSGTLLKDVKIQNWESIKEKVKDFQKKLPFVKAAGWDIAITDEGPYIIEVNDMWDRTGQLFIGRGWKREIRDCYNKWKSYYNL